jgi:hypothetical protein
VPLYGSVNYSLVATVTSDVPVFLNQRTPGGFAITVPNVFPAALRAVPGAGSQDFRRANQFDLREPRTTQRSVAVERDLGSKTGLRLSYIGNRTTDIIVSPDLNQIQSNTRGYAALANTRPFQDWNVVASRDNGAHSRYDGLHTEVTRRFSKGLTLDGSYALGRQLSDAAGAVPLDFPAENGPSLLDRFRGPEDDYGPVPFTRRHRFVATFLYELSNEDSPLSRQFVTRRFEAKLRYNRRGWIGGATIRLITKTRRDTKSTKPSVQVCLRDLRTLRDRDEPSREMDSPVLASMTEYR